jgi:hypothetical protein
LHYRRQRAGALALSAIDLAEVLPALATVSL